jgi:hypothetical protein
VGGLLRILGGAMWLGVCKNMLEAFSFICSMDRSQYRDLFSTIH